jgi:adenylate cyclase
MTEPTPPAHEQLVDLDLAEQRILGGGARYTPAEVWERAGVPEELARELWLAMGFPRTPDGERSLTERDLDALRRAGDLLASRAFDDTQLVAQTRVMSQALSTVAAAHVETLAAADRPAGFLADLAAGRATAQPGADEVAAADLLDALDRLLPYLYRRHLLAALERAVLAGEPSRPTLPTTVVGFADLTDFSAATARATEEELTDLVDDFATIAARLIATAGGRVVKLIGDEVMFSVDDPATAANLALDLVDAARCPGLPPVHVGLALGPVLGHHGDLFGSTVNVASRLADAARAGTVLVNEAMASAVSAPPDTSNPAGGRLETKRVHLRALKGLGHVPAYVLRREHPS